MISEQDAKTFYFEGNAVGYFCEDLPTTPGQHHYMPYRGVGHYNLGRALTYGPQRCHYVLNGQRHDFTVRSLISYGILDLSDFS